MSTVFRIFGLACLVSLAWFTSSKLIKMAQIRGFIAGPAPQSKTITSKAVLEGRRGDAYWIAWDSADIRIPGRKRTTLPQDIWETFSTGDRIAVYYFPGDRLPHTREGVFASNGNFGFDAVLLSAWLTGIVALVRLQFRHLRRRNGGEPPVLERA